MSHLSRRNAFILYAIILLILIPLCFIFPWFNYILSEILLFAILIATVYYTICNRSSPPQPSSSQKNAPLVTKEVDKTSNLSIQIKIPTENPATETVNPADMKPTRLYYLDNLKSILTIIVVIHHITCAFSGIGWNYILANYYNPFLVFASTITSLDQSYFMCLFFFISAYFTPTSCDRKGVQSFLKDKFKRLGIPFLIYTLIFGPLLDFWITKVAIKHNQYTYSPDPGPCWFLAWLLIFNVCYVIIDQTIPYYQMEFPSLCKVILVTFIVGIVQLIVCIVLYNGFFFMPIVQGSLPFDILFFICGVLAQRNNWLSSLSSYHVIIIRILTVLLSVVVAAAILFAYYTDILPQNKDSDAGCDKDNDDDNNDSFVYAYVAIFLIFGFCCSILCLFMLQFCEQYLNFTNNVGKFFSRTAYTVYLIHPWIINPVIWSFTQILYATMGTKLVFCDGDNFSTTSFGNDVLVWVGWIYTVVVSLVCVWPLAWIIRQLPGLNKIL